jgi:hypothetical protein
VHACRETAEYIAGKKQDGNRESDYFLFVKANQAGLQRAVFDTMRHDDLRDPDYTELDRGHGRIIRPSIWVTTAEGVHFPHASQVDRIRRDGYAPDGALISKEIVHATSGALGA